MRTVSNESWRLKTADEVTVEMSCGSVVIDHEQREGSTGLANLNLVGRDVTATLHGLTPTDLQWIARACEAFADKLDRLQREIDMDMAAAEPTEPQESRQDSGAGTEAQQDACPDCGGDGRMPDELAAMQADGFAVAKAEPAETWGVLFDIDEDARAFHIIGTKEQAERWAYDQLCARGYVTEPNDEDWQEILWEVIDDELEFRQVEFCPLAKDLDERINAFLATHLPEPPRRALPSEVAEALYWDADATNRQIAAIIMDRLEAAGMRIVKA